jgi:restriction endonuclease S subunit
MRDGWVETALGELAEITTGSRARGGAISSGIPSIGGEQIAEDRSIKFNKMKFIPEDYFESMRTGKLKFGDSLLVKDGATTGKVGYWGYSIPAAVNEHVFILRARPDRAEPYFINLLISHQSFREEIESRTRGIIGGITRDIENIEFVVPPLPEQKRIVDLISSVDSYIEALQQQLESAKRSRNAVLHELLTAGGDNWVETTLGDVAYLNPEQARDYDSDRLIKYIDLSTVSFDTGISSEIDQLPFNEAPGRARRIIRENDVIVSTVRPYLKGFAFVGKEFNGQIASTGFCVIRAKSESILSELIWALVGSDDFVDFLIRRSTGSSYPAVRPNDISDFTFMLPPLHDQGTVSKLIMTFDHTIRASSVLINSAQNLRSGLLSDLLSGGHEIPESYDKVIGAA